MAEEQGKGIQQIEGCEVIYDMGSGLVIAKVPLDKVKEQDINARIMKNEMQDQLTANIKKRGQLESLPLFVLVDGKLEIISGHHRVKSARAAGTVFATPATEEVESIEFATEEACVLNENGTGTVIARAMIAGVESNVNANVIIQDERRQADIEYVAKKYGIDTNNPAMREAAEVTAVRSREAMEMGRTQRRYY